MAEILKIVGVIIFLIGSAILVTNTVRNEKTHNIAVMEDSLKYGTIGFIIIGVGIFVYVIGYNI